MPIGLILRLAGTAIVAAILAFGIGKYNDWIRSPLVAQIQAIRDQSASLLRQREQENASLSEKWRNYARQSDEDYEERISRLRAAGSSGLRILANSCTPAGQAETPNSDAPAKPPAERGVSDAPREFVFGEVEVAQVLQWYAYGLSCHRFVNAPEPTK